MDWARERLGITGRAVGFASKTFRSRRHTLLRPVTTAPHHLLVTATRFASKTGILQ